MAPMKGGDVQSAASLVRAVLRKMAHMHYSKQTRERKAEIRRSFKGLDESDDGRISLEEFMESTEEIILGASAPVVAKIFSYVDEDKSGFLEFDEYLVFTFIMESGFQICDACLSPVIIAGYTCKTCWSERRHGSHDSYDICTDCYHASADGFDHPASHEIVDTWHMYNHLLTSCTAPSEAPTRADSSAEDKVQCSICDEYHTTNIKGLLVKGDNHVVEREGFFVCEWCASYMCNRCGEYLSDATYDQLKIRLCLRCVYWCEKCDKEGNYEPDVDKLLKVLKESEIPKNCSTCAKHLKNGTFEKEDPTRTVPYTYMEMVTTQMQNNLLLQQSYFHAASMINAGAALARLAG